MKIEVNGEQREVETGLSVATLIDQLSIDHKVAACAVNMIVVKKEQWTSHTLQEGDRVELLQFVGGG